MASLLLIMLRLFKNEKPNPFLIAEAVSCFVAEFNVANPLTHSNQNSYVISASALFGRNT